MAATPVDIVTITGFNRTYKLHDADSTLASARNQLQRFTIVDSKMTMYPNNSLPISARNVGHALQRFGKWIEDHEARNL